LKLGLPIIRPLGYHSITQIRPFGTSFQTKGFLGINLVGLLGRRLKRRKGRSFKTKQIGIIGEEVIFKGKAHFQKTRVLTTFHLHWSWGRN